MVGYPNALPMVTYICMMGKNIFYDQVINMVNSTLPLTGGIGFEGSKS